MASGTVESYKYASADGPDTYSYTQSFAAGRTQTPASVVGFDGAPTGYYCTFLGFSINSSIVIIQAFNPNAASTSNAMTNYKISSGSASYSCYFNRGFVKRDMISGLT